MYNDGGHDDNDGKGENKKQGRNKENTFCVPDPFLFPFHQHL
jgi:hypothetical protein